jgi:hypothetical protein
MTYRDGDITTRGVKPQRDAAFTRFTGPRERECAFASRTSCPRIAIFSHRAALSAQNTPRSAIRALGSHCEIFSSPTKTTGVL